MTARHEDWMLNQLPAGMLSEDFFVRFVRIFQAQAGTLLAHADNLPYLADRRITPPAMVRWMGEWLGLAGIDASFSEELQRQILATAGATLQWRGTTEGLRHLLELHSGGPVTVNEGGGVFEAGTAPDGPAWVVMEVQSTGLLEEADFLQLVLDEVPAHVHAEIWIGARRAWPHPQRLAPQEVAS
jgi:phage tail-like protein